MLKDILISLREGRNLSQDELAKRLSYSRSTIAAAEKGHMISPSLLSTYNRFFHKEIPASLELICQKCKKTFVSEKGLCLFCKECSKKVKPMGRGLLRKKYQNFNSNPITKDTVMIICMFHLEGQTVKEIASHLMRPPEVVAKLLNRAIRDGRYQMYKKMKQSGPFVLPRALAAFGFVKATRKISILEVKE